ncbi:hypothetical protein HBI40_198320 [Parastagonospora nodorum]|nr:hypothetical protein HBH49_226060 [Parastagonospora nodorum]KAH4599142.1 hypothetical protein HBH82_208280 [Parastagonospora nodorum]KAH4760973.1 hypothetical protein HBH63_209400 [Parastagonospora nodorum]KAH4771258.1 hypothetical protein HBH62_210600 [Parastagonospora nodorum]KAH5242181.1 hypothetical protein HBI71_202910 [Parastagonospora nodorum]
MQLTTSKRHTKGFVPAKPSLLPTSRCVWESQLESRKHRARQLLTGTIKRTLRPLKMASIHFSQSLSTRGEATPASSRAVQLPAMYPVSPDEPEEPAQGEASPRASADLGSSWLDLEKAETQDGFYLHPDASSSPASSISDEESETRSYLASLPTSSRSEYSALPPSQADNARYYDHALSKGDHDALIMGELNHNLRAYTPRDLVIHHESRKELVPQGIAGTDKLGEMEAFAKIEQEKQHSHQVQERNLVSQSMYDLNAARTRAASKRLTIVPPGVSRQFSFQAIPPAMSRLSHIRSASGDDYFSSRPVSHRQPSSPPSSGFSTPRVRSPLAPQPSAHRHNLSATFDSFLVPHKSGKGEAFRGTPTAKKPKAIKEKRSSSSMQPVTNTLRRLSMMPSMHSLKICKSRASLRKDSLENSDVSPLPELPEHVSYAQR